MNVGRLGVSSNASLPACEAQWLISSIANLGPASQGGNTGTGTCPP